jgi:hypothetical protein
MLADKEAMRQGIVKIAKNSVPPSGATSLAQPDLSTIGMEAIITPHVPHTACAVK